MITIGNSFVGRNHFFVEKYDKKMAKIGTIFLNFLLSFSFCFVFSKFSLPIMICLLFFEYLDTQLAEGNFSFDLYVFEILKNLVTFSSFSLKVVFKSYFFHTFSLKYFFFKIHISGFCKY